MAEQKSKKAGEIQATVKTNGDEKINFEPIKQIESDTFESVKGIKTLDYIIIALLIYLVFMLLPDIQEKVEWVDNKDTGRQDLKVIENSKFEIDADLVLLAMGFVHPLQEGLLNDLNVEFDERGNVKTNNNLMTNVDAVFSCGDMERGQSLVVHAIASGRSCAKKIDLFLQGKSKLPDVRGYFRNKL